MRLFSKSLYFCMLASFLSLALLWNDSAGAQNGIASQPALIQAETMSHNDALGVVTARGTVEISQGGRVLFADIVNYHQRTNTVSASGNVVLMESNGDTMFADFMELTNDLREGVVQQIRMLLADDSKFAAVMARRTNGNRITATRAVYSPCKICREEANSAPLWQIKAEQAVRDQTAREISYKNAFLEIYGIPVAYTPYLAHPDSTVDRKSGFLTPSFGSSRNVGGFLKVPYYWAIDNNSDATFSPIYTDAAGIVFSGEYRHHFDQGSFETSGSLVHSERRIGNAISQTARGTEFRGHILSAARVDIDDTWRAGFDLKRASDRSYLDRFDFFSNPGNTLESKAYIEGFRGRSYASANTYLYQDLRGGQRPSSPLVLPMLDYNHIGKPTSFGGRFSIDANFRSLYRSDATDSQRASLKTGYRIPFTSDLGFVTTLTAGLQTDLYYVASNGASSLEGDGFTGRVFPKVAADWRFPFVREKGNFRQLVEPMAAIVLSPNGQNPARIPSEDSVVLEIDDTNLFSSDRFPGIDRVESGQRAIFGVNLGVFGENDFRTTAFIGQSYRIHADNKLANEFGIERHLSDVVGRVLVNPNPYINLLYRFRATATDFELKRSEAGFTLGTNTLRMAGNYLFIDAEPSNIGSEKREEIQWTLSSNFYKNWNFYISSRRDLNDPGFTLSTAASLNYEDECFIFSTSANRAYTADVESEPADSFVFRLAFKTLGEIVSTIQ